MKNSKNLLLIAASMTIATMSATNDPISIQVGEHIVFEVFETGNNAGDSNVLRSLARNCGDKDFEMALQLRVKPFAIDKNTIEQDGEEAFNNNVKELLFTQDENGQTAVDIIRERAKATGNLDCVMLYQLYENIKWDILREEHTKKEKEIEAALERNQQ